MHAYLLSTKNPACTRLLGTCTFIILRLFDQILQTELNLPTLLNITDKMRRILTKLSMQ